jgi:hypothetical protein
MIEELFILSVYLEEIASSISLVVDRRPTKIRGTRIEDRGTTIEVQGTSNQQRATSNETCGLN